MKWLLVIFCYLFVLCSSCTKEYSCQNCPGNTAPPVPPVPQTPQSPAITALDCTTGIFSATATEAIPYSGQYTISYSGGNGKIYDADTIASSGVTGLTAVLIADTLANGNGSLIYIISGTPATSGNATFMISFSGKNCTAMLKVDPDVALAGIIRIPIASEKERNMVLLGNGTVKTWGNNEFGQLGDGTTTDRHTPVLVSNLTNIASVAAGAYHSMALTNSGKVWIWGRNAYGQLGDGTLIEDHLPKQVAGLSNIISIAAGFDYSLALKNDGTVWAWGGNIWGVIGDGTYTPQPRPAQVINLTNIVAIAAGTEHCLALKNDGTVWAWGWNANGCLGENNTIVKRSTPEQVAGLSNITAIAANGSLHNLALKNDGTVWTWGDNMYGQLGDGSLTEKYVPTQLALLNNITTIGTGERHSFAIKNDGTLFSWGWNGNGQLGIDFISSFHQSSPVNITLLKDVKRITGGSYHSLAQKNDGSIYTMGGNVYGQLGDGSNVLNRHVPMIVPGL